MARKVEQVQCFLNPDRVLIQTAVDWTIMVLSFVCGFDIGNDNGEIRKKWMNGVKLG